MRIYLTVNKDGTECISNFRPVRKDSCSWGKHPQYEDLDNELNTIELPKGTIYKLIKENLTWDDSPVELKEEML